jgi:hypothetical protein
MPAPKLHHPAPAGLSKAGSALWRTIASKYQLRPDELAVLEDACRTADTIAALESAWAEDGTPMTTRGSMGQLVIHPLIGELRAQRNARAALLRQLKLPDDPTGEVATNQNRDAATASWQPGVRGRGA